MAYFAMVTLIGNRKLPYVHTWGGRDGNGYKTEAGARKGGETFSRALKITVMQFPDVRAALKYANEVTELLQA